ncbi:MAG: response regulator [bacterium]
MAEKINVELDQKFIQNLFGLADLNPPSEINSDNLNNAISIIKTKFNNLALSSGGMGGVKTPSTETVKNAYMANEPSNVVRPKSILIVDDLGIITYQLEVMFKKLGFDVCISQEIYDAIDKFKKQDFGYAIIDLFIPTEREGFILLDELKKLTLLCKLNTKIIVMTASSKSEYQTKCTNRGADVYVEKAPGWQKKLVEVCQ